MQETSVELSINAQSPMHDSNSSIDQKLVEQELSKVALQQGAIAPWAEFVAFTVLGWVFSKSTHTPYLLVWLGLLGIQVFARWQLCRRALMPSFPAERLVKQNQWLFAIRYANGLVLGIGVMMWLPDASEFGHVVVLCTVVAWQARVSLLSVPYPRGANFFGIALLTPVSVGWILHEPIHGLIFAIMSASFLMSTQTSIDRLHATVRDKILSRMREEALTARLEAQRAEQEAAIRAKSHFLAAASHDLRQPVTSMNLLLSAVQTAKDEEALRRLLIKFEAPLKALEEVLTSILEVSRLEAGIIETRPRRCELTEMLEPMISEYRSRAASKRVQLESELPEVLFLQTDPDLVRRIVRNLLDNAVKFTDIGVVRIDAKQLGSDLQIRVRDTGPGIAQEQQHRVFEDYFQADNWHRDRRQGLGLGLSIVRRLVDLLHCQILLESRPGHGSTFTLLLKGVIDPEQDDDDFSDDLFEPNLGIEVDSVLVVEDDRLVVDALATVFSSIGVKARYALDGEDALMQTALGRFIPDLALVDFGLPGRYDGLTLISHLKTRLPNCLFLLVTGDTHPEVLRRATDEGVPVLHKPITMARLADKLRQIGVRT